MSSISQKSVKLVVVGDGMVGKTCLLSTFVKGEFPNSYIPTVFETYSTNVTVDNQLVTLSLWDTAGQEDYDRLRPLSYPETSVLLICFSIIHPDSFCNIKDKWFPEIKHHCPKAKIILVGTKKDLKEDLYVIDNLKRERKLPVSVKQAETLKIEMKANLYIECSAKTRENLDLVFTEAIRLCIGKSQHDSKNKKCSLL